MPQTQTRPGDVTQIQHQTLAMTTLMRIGRYAEADLKAGRPSVEHADQILLAAAVYLKQAVATVEAEECAARHGPRAEATVRQPAAVPHRFAAG